MALANRADLRRALGRLLGLQDLDDPELEERGESTNEVLHDKLEIGLRAAQRFLVDIGAGEEWLTNETLTFGAADDTGAKSATLSGSLLRFAGDDDYPALYRDDGKPWGRLLTDSRLRRTAQGNWFYWADGKLWVTPLANLPTSVLVDYYELLSLPSDDSTVVDFPADARPLIVAEAAMDSVAEYWVPTSDRSALEARLERHWRRKRTDAAQAMRRTTGRQELRAPATVGSHYWLS